MEIIVEIVGLAVKICTVPIDGILIGMFTKSKAEVLTKVCKTIVEKIVESKIVVPIIEEHKIVEHIISIANDCNSGAEEEGRCSSVDQVIDTSINDLLSYEGVKSD